MVNFIWITFHAISLCFQFFCSLTVIFLLHEIELNAVNYIVCEDALQKPIFILLFRISFSSVVGYITIKLNLFIPLSLFLNCSTLKLQFKRERKLVFIKNFLNYKEICSICVIALIIHSSTLIPSVVGEPSFWMFYRLFYFKLHST